MNDSKKFKYEEKQKKNIYKIGKKIWPKVFSKMKLSELKPFLLSTKKLYKLTKKYITRGQFQLKAKTKNENRKYLRKEYEKFKCYYYNLFYFKNGIKQVETNRHINVDLKEKLQINWRYDFKTGTIFGFYECGMKLYVWFRNGTCQQIFRKKRTVHDVHINDNEMIVWFYDNIMYKYEILENKVKLIKKIRTNSCRRIYSNKDYFVHVLDHHDITIFKQNARFRRSLEDYYGALDEICLYKNLFVFTTNFSVRFWDIEKDESPKDIVIFEPEDQCARFVTLNDKYIALVLTWFLVVIYDHKGLELHNFTFDEEIIKLELVGDELVCFGIKGLLNKYNLISGENIFTTQQHNKCIKFKSLENYFLYATNTEVNLHSFKTGQLIRQIKNNFNSIIDINFDHNMIEIIYQDAPGYCIHYTVSYKKIV